MKKSKINNDLEIAKVLTLSTAHVSQETAKLLENSKISITVYPKGDYGWFIYLDDEVMDEMTKNTSIPKDLITIAKLAHKNKCTWVCLDRDGRITENLPTYKW